MLVNKGYMRKEPFQPPTGLEAEINEWKYKETQAKRRGNFKALRDIRKHLAKLYGKRHSLR